MKWQYSPEWDNMQFMKSEDGPSGITSLWLITCVCSVVSVSYVDRPRATLFLFVDIFLTVIKFKKCQEELYLIFIKLKAQIFKMQGNNKMWHFDNVQTSDDFPKFT